MKQLIFLIALLGFSACKNNTEKTGSSSQEQANVVNVYTHRHYSSDQELFDLFEKNTGIQVNVINASADELIQKMKIEGAHSPADVLITVDAGRLTRAKELNLLQPVNSELLKKTIAPHLRDPEDYWFGLTKRARILVYAKDRMEEANLSTYEDLAGEKWKGKILIRSSGNIYNQSLLASLIVNNGEAGAKKWAQAIVNNMARAPKGNDRDQVKALVAGEGEVAVVNTYYIGNMLNSESPEEVKAAKAIGVFFPNQKGRGAHINISGAGVARYAPNRENAIHLIEFLISREAQEIFANTNYEYPVNPEVQPAALLQSWGEFREDSLLLSKLGENNKNAVMIFDEAGWK